jgi:hypothetical protein
VYTRGVQREEVKGDLERRKANAEAERLTMQMQTANLHAPPPVGLSTWLQYTDTPCAPLR